MICAPWTLQMPSRPQTSSATTTVASLCIEASPSRIARAPPFRRLNARLSPVRSTCDSARPRMAQKLRFDMRPELIGNPRRQILHGGVISAVLDVAAGFAVHLAVSKNRIENPDATHFPTIGTIDLRVDYHLRPG